jgi:2-dehydropantoate 2-reductase
MIAFTEGMGPYLPSMLIDRREGRQLELEAIMGRPIVMGEAQGISLPRTSAVHALLSLVCEGLS